VPFQQVVAITNRPSNDDKLRGGRLKAPYCYDSKLKGLSNELTLVLSDTRKLDRVPNTK